MTDVVVTLLVETLGEYIIQEAVKLKNVQKDLENLQAELISLSYFLQDAEAKRNKNASIRHHVNKIKGLVADAEDVIERFILKRYPSKGDIRGCFTSTVKRPIVLSKLQSEIEEITTKLSNEKKSMRDLGVVEIINRQVSSSTLKRQRETRQTFPQINESDHVVGFECNIKYLVTRLVEEKHQSQVVSICGMGGIGKTTLAKQVFHHGEVRRHFNRFAWVCVSQQCRRGYVWGEIFRKLTEEDDGCLVNDEKFQEELYELLENNKCLVVLDDIWHTKDWDAIKPIFPIKTGSKILITTRKEEIGFHADPNNKNVNFKPDCLNNEDSWELFARKIFCGQNDAEAQMDEGTKKLAEKMLKQCGGLPLAILALGGLLSGKDSLTQWKTVYEDMERSGIGSEQMVHDSVSQILSLSYDDLPPDLRNCFLYLSHYPEDSVIRASELIRCWIAEEMIIPAHSSRNQSRKKIAEGYLEELVMRSMVLVEERSIVNSRIKKCRMHDVMGQFSLKKAEEENFFEVINACAKSSKDESSNPSVTTKPRRIAIHDGNVDITETTIRLERLKRPKARTLRITGSLFAFWELPCDYLKHLKFIRVLDLRNGCFDDGRLPKSIGKLIHLRYLNLGETNLTALPSSIRNLRLLVYLYLETLTEEVYVPNVLKNLRKLKYLKLPRNLSSRVVKLELGDLVDLEILKNFPLGICDWRDLLNMTKLRTLQVIRKVGGGDEFLLPAIGDAFKNIESFKISPYQFWESQFLRVNASQLLQELTSVNEIYLGSKLENLPDARQFPPHIISICLLNCKTEEDPIPILEKLPHLRFLRLVYQVFMSNAWKMVCSNSGFPQLHHLSLDSINNLEELTVEEGSLPQLSTLEISSCPRLATLPDGLKYVRTLQTLEIFMMEGFKERLEKAGEDYYKVQHIPSVIVTDV